MMAAHNSVQCSIVDVPSPLEIFFVHCQASNPPVVIGVCYRPPEADTSFTKHFHDAIYSVTTAFPNAPLILFGDFNFPGITWSNVALTASKHNAESDFLNSCLTFGLSQLISKPTRQTEHSSNILDLLLTSHPDNFSTVSYLSAISDHSVLQTTFQCYLPNPKKIKRTITLYDKGNYRAINDELTAFSESFLTDFFMRTVETNWHLFKTKLQHLIKVHVPTVTLTIRSTSPWFNASLKRLKNKKKRQFRSAKHSDTQYAWDKYKATEKLFDSLAAKAKRSFYSSTLPDMLRKNPKQFWKTINPSSITPSSNITLRDEQNVSIPEHYTSHVLNETFCSVFTIEPDGDLPHALPVCHPIMSKIVFHANGISKIIDSLKLTSSMGIDGINTKILKNTKIVTSVILSNIFQQSLSSGVVPQDWKVGKVIPIPKKGNSYSPKNYRPISLTSVCSKIMEHVIYSHIVNFLAPLHFFHKNQHGFQKGVSCDTQLALFTNDISSSIDVNIPVDALFLDFEKAFDKVPHKRLFLKLSCLNLDPLVFNWICDFLTNRQQFVYANNLSSSLRPVISGVPQGTVLGPLLFLIYINDLPNNISSNIRLFADDCVIYRPINNTSDVHELQSDLHKIEIWCTTWLMSLNANKTSLVSFHRRQCYPSPAYFINNTQISCVTTYKYLGVHFSSDLTWSLHITHITNEANRALGCLRRNLHLAPTPVKLLAYQTLIRPKLEYACAVWDPHQSNNTKTLETVQSRAARFIFSDYSYQSSVTELKSRANLATLSSRRCIARLCLFFKFYHGSPRTPTIKPAHRHSDRINHRKAVYPPRAHTTAHLSSFFVKTAQDWNGLPPHVAHHSSIINFKAAIEHLLL